MMFTETPIEELFDPKAKVVTGIVSCRARTQHRNAIRATFLAALPSPVFIVGNPDSETRTEGDTLLLKCDDTYEGLPQKLWVFYEWLLRTSDFEYVFKLDDDCLVHLQSLYAFLFKLYASEERSDYLGGGINRPVGGNGLRRDWHIGKVTDPSRNVQYEGVFGYPFCKGGYGVFLSRKAVTAIVDEGRKTFFDPKEIYEDKLHGDVLCPRGMLPHQIEVPILTTDLKPNQFSRLHIMQNGNPGSATEGPFSVKGAK